MLGIARQYNYDTLNRLTSAQDIAGSTTSSGESTNTSDGSQVNALATSQNLGGNYWGVMNATISPNTTTGPDGSYTAFTMTGSTGSTDSSVAAYAPTPTLFDGATVGASVWLKVPTGSSNLTTNIVLVDVGDNWAATSKSITVTPTWQQFTIPAISVQNGLVTLALQIGGSSTITAGQVVDIWGAELNVAGAPDTNILPSSQQIGAAGWQISGGGITATSVAAPDGSTSASTVTSSSANGIISDYVANPSQYSSTTVTGSIYLCLPAGAAARSVNLHLGNTVSSGASSYLANATVALTTTWQRFAIAGIVPSSTTQLWLQVGDGAPAFSSGQTINMWGAQMVVGSTDGTYVATTDTTTSPAGVTEYLAANGLNESYMYDAFGNIRQSGNLTFEQQYTIANQLSGWNYDSAGNLLSDQLGGNYTYDANGMISNDNGTAYYYDAMGNRAGKSGSTPTDTIYFGGKAVARLSGGVWTDLIYGPGGLIAENTSGTSGSLVYRMTDSLGSSVGMLSSTGTVLSTRDSAPFGQTFAGGTSDPYLFTGKERDSESGLDYFGARYYSSNMGRFSSPDPSGLIFADLGNPQSLNLYSYGRNNPLINTDPTGLDCVHINNDTGAYEGFESGDCDNRTEESANTGHYIDGTVNQISFNGQGQVNGYSASTSDGTFDTPGGNSGPGVANLNPYTNAVTGPGNSVSVTAGQSPELSASGVSMNTLIPNSPLQVPNLNVSHYVSAAPKRQKLTQGQIYNLCFIAAQLQGGGTVPGGNDYGTASSSPSADPASNYLPVPDRKGGPGLAYDRVDSGSAKVSNYAALASLGGTFAACIAAVQAAN